jgi:hypothetical protein
MNIEIQTTVEITPKQIRDLIVTAFEGGIEYWATDVELVLCNGEPKKSPWYDDPAIYGSSFEIKMLDVEDGETVYTLTREKLLRGLTMLADPKHNRHDCFLSLLNGDYDADDADVIIQMAVHGDLIFG